MPVLPELPDLGVIAFCSFTEMFGEDFDLCVLGVSPEFKLGLATADVIFEQRHELPDKLALPAQLFLEDGAGPDMEPKSRLSKSLALPGAFAMQLRTTRVSSEKENEGPNTFVTPALCVLEELRASPSDQRLVASLVALALTRRFRLVAIVDQDVNAFLALAPRSITFSGLYLVLLLNQLATQVLENIVADCVKRGDLSRR
jgi:hypothetical protein